MIPSEKEVYELQGIELEAVRDFRAAHRHPKKPPVAIGGHFSIVFNPTSVGVACKIRCLLCRKEKDVTDYESW